MRYRIDARNTASVIHRNIYGHFSEHLGRCVYEGLYVGEDSPIPNTRGMRNDVVAALRGIKIPVLRWPGGCFADDYHWMDGVGPKEKRPTIVNVHWGNVTENNHFGTHEFLELCEQLGCAPYICGNLGSGTVREMRDWVEYITFEGRSPMADLRKENGREQPWKLPYFGVGNENWGCGGNMRAEYYADEYKRYATYVRSQGGNPIKRIACGPSDDNDHWTEVMMREAGRMMDGLALHHYTLVGPWRKKGSATGFTAAEYETAVKSAHKMDELIKRHCAIMDVYDPEKRVALVVDEWGMWHDPEPGTNPGFLYQQNTMRDAVVAAIHLNQFNNHSDRVRMANLAQTVNVLQSVVLTDGPRMLLTPTYHVFEMFKGHQNTLLLPVINTSDSPILDDKTPKLSVSASLGNENLTTLTLCNASLFADETVEIVLEGRVWASANARVLTGSMDAHNTFEQPENVRPVALPVSFKDNLLTLSLPRNSVAVIEVQ